ncbi:MAG: serine hydrolase domain-containing protein, partial [Planctomycetota bacterium]
MKTQLALAFLFLTLSAPAQDQAVVQGKLARSADDYLTRCEAFGFSGTVLVESQGQVILEKAYGFADRATGVANEVDTLFDLGSLTKQFTAAAVLCLEQDKKLKTSDRLGEFFENVPEEMAKIELHHLLNHTSGLPRADNGIGSVLQDREEFLKTIFSCSLHSKPGKSFVYSNIGYDLLAAVVEVASEHSFEDFCRERLFAPAKMTSTDFRGGRVLDDAKSAFGHAEPIVLSLPGSTIQGE